MLEGLIEEMYTNNGNTPVFIMKTTTKQHCILLCFLKMGSNWIPLYAKTQVVTIMFFNCYVNVLKSMCLTMC